VVAVEVIERMQAEELAPELDLFLG